MSARRINDIAPPKRSVRDIPLPRSRARVREVVEVAPEIASNAYEQLETRAPKRGMRRLVLIVVVLAILGLLGLLASYFFREVAQVTVTEYTRDVSLQTTFLAKKEPKDGELAFTLVPITKEAQKIVPATGEKQVESRASGTIVIYNDYSNSTQRLIRNTRFETADGKIYKVDQSVTVPGKDKKTGAPGNIEVVVYADTAGEAHNIGLTDFTLPGIEKSDPRFGKIYARSKTPMTGGYVGKIKTASEADLALAENELKEILKTEVAQAALLSIPPQSILFLGALYTSFETMSPEGSNDIRIKAVSYALTFDAKEMSKAIAKATIADYENQDILAEQTSSLMFKPIPEDARPWQSGAVSFSLTGTTTLVYQFDVDQLRKDLAGQPKQKMRISEILKAYPGIADAEVVVRPFWQSTLPVNPQDIEVVIGKK